ncbi:hypothetical protein BDC45DRAFT_563236 [Circinella umbellata]|nr:hypothetical protein BDC45DRAFT_563236 [Circinella umbellata]
MKYHDVILDSNKNNSEAATITKITTVEHNYTNQRRKQELKCSSGRGKCQICGSTNHQTRNCPVSP